MEILQDVWIFFLRYGSMVRSYMDGCIYSWFVKSDVANNIDMNSAINIATPMHADSWLVIYQLFISHVCMDVCPFQ